MTRRTSEGRGGSQPARCCAANAPRGVREPDRRHGKEVDQHQAVDVIVQEGAPALRWRLAMPRHILGHAGSDPEPRRQRPGRPIRPCRIFQVQSRRNPLRCQLIKAVDALSGQDFNAAWPSAEAALKNCRAVRAVLFDHEHTHGCAKNWCSGISDNRADSRGRFPAQSHLAGM